MKTKVTREQILASVDEQKIKEAVQAKMLYPVTVVEGIRKDGLSVETYRCPFCGHEWVERNENPYFLSRDIWTCPACEQKGIGRRSVEAEKTDEVNYFSWEDEHGYRYSSDRILVADTAVFEKIKGIVLCAYKFKINLSYESKVQVLEFTLTPDYCVFIGGYEKFLYNPNGKRIGGSLYTAFQKKSSFRIIEKSVKEVACSFIFYHDHAFDLDKWMMSYDDFRDVTQKSYYVPKGVRDAQETLKKYRCSDIPKAPGKLERILSKKVCENTVTGKYRLENYCMNCGTVFQDESFGMYSTSVCPCCGLSCKQDGIYTRCNVTEEICYISQEKDNVLALRLIRYDYKFDEVWNMTVSSNESYRCLIVFCDGKEPKIHFLRNEGYGTSSYWTEKNNYASDKFAERIKKVEYIGDIPLLKYSGLRQFVEHIRSKSYYPNFAMRDIISYIRFEKMYPVVERISKRGLCSVLEDEFLEMTIQRGRSHMELFCDKVSDALGMSEAFVKMLIQTGESTNALEMLQRLYVLDPNMRPEDFEWLRTNGIAATDVERIFAETPMTIMRLCEYLEHVRINQCFDPKPAIADWYDYLRAAKTIEVDLTDNKAKYPSSLKREHDRAVAKQKVIFDAKKDEFFREQTDRYGALYGYRDEHYLITVPKDMKDLFEEGRKLCHCVGSYSDRIIKGETCIMFIRKTEEPEKPYFTIEVNQRDNYVVQLRGLSNRLIDRVNEKALVEFLLEWARKKRLIIDRVI